MDLKFAYSVYNKSYVSVSLEGEAQKQATPYGEMREAPEYAAAAALGTYHANAKMQPVNFADFTSEMEWRKG